MSYKTFTNRAPKMMRAMMAERRAALEARQNGDERAAKEHEKLAEDKRTSLKAAHDRMSEELAKQNGEGTNYVNGRPVGSDQLMGGDDVSPVVRMLRQKAAGRTEGAASWSRSAAKRTE